MSSTQAFSIAQIAPFNARGRRRCAVPGVGATVWVGATQSMQSVADFWQGQDGAVLMRVTCMNWCWSFQVNQSSGKPLHSQHELMGELAVCVEQELVRWMAEDAADLPPFDVE
jgi:hypothetical protein